MNGVHDLGGMHGFGPVEREANEPVFHSEWERRVFALNVIGGMLGTWNIDMSRYAREQMPPAEYLATSYYEHWLYGLEKLAVEQGLVTQEELDARVKALETGRVPAPKPAAAPQGVRVVRPAEVERLLSTGNPFRVDAEVPPRFKAGDRVITKNFQPLGHTRLPRYARAKRGAIDRDHGVFVFPDTNAARRDKKPQHCYSVRFDAREIWGPASPANEFIHIDLWDDYLEPA